MMSKSIAKETVKSDVTMHQNHQSNRQIPSPFQPHNDKNSEERKRQRHLFDRRANSISIEEFLKSLPLHQRAIHTLQLQIELIQKNPENWKQILEQTQGACGELLALSDVSGNAPQEEQSTPKMVEPIKETTIVQTQHNPYENIPVELIELLKNPSVRALLTPPTKLQLELKKEVDRMIKGEFSPLAMYPTGRGKDKPNPRQFTLDTYLPYIEANCLYLYQLRKIDPVLVKALENRAFSLDEEIPVIKERDRTDIFIRDLDEFILEKIAAIGSVLSTRYRVNVH